ncbi:acyl-CoA dehydrogenase family protein [Phenylobacterium sp.]|uniref:acyl-CoA dehydrogenase family protein n=1 Tax=Phenylobacterium sp. TaxID=1871053 RepID=UPI0027371BFA|nr:acyl-CoA dehydrogenase family protein [Phenylobacterium sp.]MDP3659419.1 acyl-CoA dehydrogenase family protein [Phenylobacterium sp.]
MWSFSNDPEFQPELDWIDTFVREEVEPLDVLLGSQWDIHAPEFKRLVRPLQQKVKDRGLWACHLGPELGGKGYGQLKLALMNEKFGRSRFGPIVFGSQAPDTGNSEILAHYGTPEQKKKYLEPLLNNDIVSCFSMTEPQGGADPLVLAASAVRDGDDWVINGDKWFASNARYASFYIVMVVTDPDAAPYRRMSMFIVPADTPGIEIVRNYGFYGEPENTHGHVRWTNVRVPAENMLGGQGDAFVVAQVRLSGGRMHHAMRTLAQATRAFEMMCERAVSRFTKGEQLSKKQMVQEKIADSWTELRQFRLLILETAWLADQGNDWKAIRKNVAAVKATMPKLLHDIAARALQVHGSLGISHEMPFAELVINSFHIGLADGPTEVHKVTVAREVLKDYAPINDIFPSYIRHELVAEAHELYDALQET